MRRNCYLITDLILFLWTVFFFCDPARGPVRILSTLGWYWFVCFQQKNIFSWWFYLCIQKCVFQGTFVSKGLVLKEPLLLLCVCLKWRCIGTHGLVVVDKTPTPSPWTALKWTDPERCYFEWVLLRELLFIYLHCTYIYAYCALPRYVQCKYVNGSSFSGARP